MLAATLRSFWAAVTLLCAAACLAPAGSAFREVLAACAGRGKLASTLPGVPRWLNLHVPHAWFAHFYVLGAAWNGTRSSTRRNASGRADAAFLLSVAGVVLWRRLACVPIRSNNLDSSAGALLAQLLFQAHLLRRLLESTCAARMAREARMHVGGYAFGLTYYLAAGLSWLPPHDLVQVASMARECSVGNAARNVVVLWRALRPLHAVGAAVFAHGSVHQLRCHAILRDLRSRAHNGGASSRAPRYGIPRGDWFERVSCAHYLAEVVLYAGLTLTCGGSVTAVLLLLAVATNLHFAASLTHQWYLSNLKAYPRTRVALWPRLR